MSRVGSSTTSRQHPGIPCLVLLFLFVVGCLTPRLLLPGRVSRG